MREALWSAAAKLPLLEPEACFRLRARQQAGAKENGSFAAVLQNAFGAAIFIAEATKITER